MVMKDNWRDHYTKEEYAAFLHRAIDDALEVAKKLDKDAAYFRKTGNKAEADIAETTAEAQRKKAEKMQKELHEIEHGRQLKPIRKKKQTAGKKKRKNKAAAAFFRKLAGK